MPMTWEKIAEILGFADADHCREASHDFYPWDFNLVVTQLPDGRAAHWDDNGIVCFFPSWNEAVERLIEGAKIEYEQSDTHAPYFSEHPEHQVGVTRFFDGEDRITRFRLEVVDDSGRDVGAGGDEVWG